MLSNMFFALKVSEVPTQQSLREYIENGIKSEDVPAGITSCEAFGIVDRTQAGWELSLSGSDWGDCLFHGRASVLSVLLRHSIVQKFLRIAFVVKDADFADFSTIANDRSVCGQYCEFADTRLQSV